MGYPMSYPRVVLRNGLNGSYGATPGDADAQWKRMIAGDLRRLEQDARDDHHITKFMEATGATENEVRSILHSFFTDFNAVTQPWLGADPHAIQPEPLKEFAEFVVSLDDVEMRRSITLTKLIWQARKALGEDS